MPVSLGEVPCPLLHPDQEPLDAHDIGPLLDDPAEFGPAVRNGLLNPSAVFLLPSAFLVGQPFLVTKLGLAVSLFQFGHEVERRRLDRLDDRPGLTGERCGFCFLPLY